MKINLWYIHTSHNVAFQHTQWFICEIMKEERDGEVWGEVGY